LFFVGLPWLHTAKSGLIYGLREDACYVADRIAERRDTAEDGHAIAPQGASKGPRRSRRTEEWANRVMTLVWSSSLSLKLDGFATHAIGSYPTAPNGPPQNATFAVGPRDAISQQR
jgi:putative flavoprotein involved in K+ transport